MSAGKTTPDHVAVTALRRHTCDVVIVSSDSPLAEESHQVKQPPCWRLCVATAVAEVAAGPLDPLQPLDTVVEAGVGEERLAVDLAARKAENRSMGQSLDHLRPLGPPLWRGRSPR